MSNYIIKIEPEHRPQLVDGDRAREYIDEAFGPIVELSECCSALRGKHPGIRILSNDSIETENCCPSNLIATVLRGLSHRGEVFGAAILGIVEGSRFRPLTAAESTDIRDTIEQLYDIEFEEGEKK